MLEQVGKGNTGQMQHDRTPDCMELPYQPWTDIHGLFSEKYLDYLTHSHWVYVFMRGGSWF